MLREESPQNHVPEKHDFLEILDSTPESKKWSLVREWIESSSLPFFKVLREQRPIIKTTECTLIALYDDVIDALNHPTIFTVALYKPKMGEFLMTEDDTPLHNHDRAIMLSLLKREDLPRIRNYIAEKCISILGQKNGEINLIKEYSRTIPVSLVQDVFGLDGINPKKLLKWSHLNQFDAFNNQHFQNFSGRENIEKNRKKSNFWLFLYGLTLLIRKKLFILIGKPKNDTVTRMLSENSFFKKGFGLVRQTVNAAGLLIGTVETTSEAVSNALNQLFKHPEHLKLAISLAKGEDTQAFDNLVWEALRSQPIAPYLMRKTSQDYIIAKGTDRETVIAKDTVVLCLIGSAMFDSTVFENPEQFDPTRPYGKSFQFGFASHECIGKMIGMVMIPEMVRQILLQPNIKEISKQQFNGGPFPQSHVFSWGD